MGSPPPPERRCYDPSPRLSLYVGGLDPQVTEKDLILAFCFVGPIKYVRIHPQSHSGNSLRYAYVGFFAGSHAFEAMVCLNNTELKGKPMRIGWSEGDPLPKITSHVCVFVKNLDTSITSTDLHDMFCEFGTILSCRVPKKNKKSMGCGFVRFATEESATNAVTALNDTIIKGKKLYVSKYVDVSERIPAYDEEKFKVLCVQNLDEKVTENQLRGILSSYGTVCTLFILEDNKGKSRGLGFVKFESAEEANKAAKSLNGLRLGSKVLFVGRPEKKSLVSVRNIDTSITSTHLKDLFGGFGTILACKVVVPYGKSDLVGFVKFVTAESARNAVTALNDKMFNGKKLRVSKNVKWWGALAANKGWTARASDEDELTEASPHCFKVVYFEPPEEADDEAVESMDVDGASDAP